MQQSTHPECGLEHEKVVLDGQLGSSDFHREERNFLGQGDGRRDQIEHALKESSTRVLERLWRGQRTHRCTTIAIEDPLVGS